MYLKSIELSGFKSFAKKSELTFSSSISAIVGPNGSGKSNIAEAFQFVLGEQSIKSLRGKKGEDLIFNGAGDLPRGNRASVKITLDNSTRFLPVDFELVTIERVVHRDGVNEYMINGSLVRLKDVVELLASAHIGSSGHHIISQGEADRILNASIKERKEMIEDALGLKQYQYKKIESERKLEKTKENIAQVESLRREILPHIKFLKKQVEKVEKAVELKKDLLTLAMEYCNREQEYITRIQKQIVEERTPLEYTLHSLEKELISAREILEKSTHKDVLSEDLVRVEKKLHDVRSEKDTLFRDLGRLDGEMHSLVRMIEKQESQQSHVLKTVTLASVESLGDIIKEKIVYAKKQSDAELHVLDEILILLTEYIENNKDNIDMSLVVETKKEIEDFKQKKQEIESQLEGVKISETNFATEYSELMNTINVEKDSNRDAEKAVFRISAEEQEAKSKLRVLQNQDENLKLVREDFKRELTELGMFVGTYMLQFETLSFNYAEHRTVQDDRRRHIEKIKIRLEESGGVGGGDIVKEYTDATERDAFLAKELIDLDASATSLTELITDLNLRLLTEFKIGVEKINTQFKEYFALMFSGGHAELSVIQAPKKKQRDLDISDVLEDGAELEEIAESESGIDIDVNLPKKKVKGLMMLSGGERALTSIALLFAISQVNPPPFIILDETDAALDEANSKKYADMIENLSKYSQLIVITHNRETMSRAGILYGVTMAFGGGSKLLSVAFDEAVAVAK